MLRWSDEQLMYRKAVRRFVETVIAPQRDALEHESLPPYGVLRKFYANFGVGESAMERFEATMSGGPKPPRSASEKIIPLIEFSRYSPGLVTALGASIDLTGGAILRAGSAEQKRRWVPDLLTLDKIGAWAITEPESGSDAFGSMRATASANWSSPHFLMLSTLLCRKLADASHVDQARAAASAVRWSLPVRRW